MARSADGEIETVLYQFLSPMLLNEYQRQQRTIETLQAQNEMLRVQVAALTERLARLEKQDRH